MNVEEEKKLTDDMAPTNAPNYSCWLHLPVELKSLQMFRESECSHDNSKTGSHITEITQEEEGLSGNHFLFQHFFFTILAFRYPS